MSVTEVVIIFFASYAVPYSMPRKTSPSPYCPFPVLKKPEEYLCLFRVLSSVYLLLFSLPLIVAPFTHIIYKAIFF